MTGTEVDLETQARRIAARGRDALIERLRIAYSDAAAAHADLISLDDERIEAMVQSAADRADGLQWRRALAAVAAEELGLSSSDALAHPAVVRAQSLVGAPSYEQSLAEMIARPVPLPVPATENGSSAGGEEAEPGAAEPEADATEPEADTTEPEADTTEPQPDAAKPAAPVVPEPVSAQPEPVPAEQPEPVAAEQPEPVPVEQPEPVPAPTLAAGGGAPEQNADGDEPSDELEVVQADDVVLELLPEPEPIEYETEAYDVEASFAEEQLPPAPVNPFAAQTPHEAAASQELNDGFDQLTEEPSGAGSAPPMTAGEANGSATFSEPLPDEAEAEVTIAAIHLGGVANLPTKREGLSVRLSADGLDIMQSPRDIIGRLVWDEIEALEVPHLRARRRSKQPRARLVVRTPNGDASFEVPDVAADDLRDRVEPLMRLYGRR
jgi:hypothetical protein